MIHIHLSYLDKHQIQREEYITNMDHNIGQLEIIYLIKGFHHNQLRIIYDVIIVFYRYYYSILRARIHTHTQINL